MTNVCFCYSVAKMNFVTITPHELQKLTYIKFTPTNRLCIYRIARIRGNVGIDSGLNTLTGLKFRLPESRNSGNMSLQFYKLQQYRQL
jgi:hypothetical protein